MKAKRTLACFLCFVLVFCGVTVPSFAAGRDTTMEEALADDLKALGLFKGVSETDYALGRSPTRVEALVMLIRVLGKEGDAQNGSWEHPFTDVPQWANSYVGYAYHNGLTNGISADKFGTGNANAAMYLTFVLRALGYSDANGEDFTWNDPYPLAMSVGILPQCVDTTNFWRADVVTVSYAALPVAMKNTKQTLAEKLITMGVFTREMYDVHYDAGALNSQAGATEKMNAEQIAEACSDAVFYVEMYGFNGALAGSGSGFFISETGLAVTNYHVAANSIDIHVTTSDGTKYTDVAIIDAIEEYDLALLRVNGGTFPYLRVGDSNSIKQGQNVFAIGSPLGLQNTLSQGIISNTHREIEEKKYIQVSAQIASGSSGGALINEYGQVIGVTTAGFISAGADLNLAIPSNCIRELDMSSTTSELIWATDDTYDGYNQALDFGSFSGVDLLAAYTTSLGYYFVYDLWDFYSCGDYDAASCFAYTQVLYQEALELNGFLLYKELEDGFIYSTDDEFLYYEVSWDEGEIRVLIEDCVVYYDEFPGLPDFGWYVGVPEYSMDIIDESTMYSYYWADEYSSDNFSNAVLWYCYLLEDFEYTCAYADGENWLYEGYGYSVYFGINQNWFFVDVAPL